MSPRRLAYCYLTSGVGFTALTAVTLVRGATGDVPWNEAGTMAVFGALAGGGGLLQARNVFRSQREDADLQQGE